MDPWLKASARAQAAAIRAGELSSRQLVEAHLERVARVNPHLNAVVQLDAETSLREAREADDRLARGQPVGPLHGVPFTVKDWIETRGLVCAAGLMTRQHLVPKRDATVVARMRAAGAILLGKTNVLEDNEVYGKTRNPYALERTPGLSTSDEAAIIAACGSPLGLGSDSGGSLRFPAHCCGLATLKPTAGRVPNTGHFPRISAMNDPRTQIGPLARHVEDLELALRVIAGVDWRDPGVIPVPLDNARDVRISGLRAAYFVEMPGATPDDATTAAVGSVAAALADAGVTVVEERPPEIGQAFGITRQYWQRVRSVSWNEWVPDHAGGTAGMDVDRSLFEWDRFRRSMLSFVERFDAVICPVAERPAGLHGSVAERDFLYTLPFSLTGWPVAVVRAGASPEGLPIGVQIAAQPWRDDVALALARVIEAALGGWRPPPESR